MKKETCEKPNSCREFTHAYFARLSELMASIVPEDIDRVIKVFDRARIIGKRIFFVGNGGSAATAMHFANDLGSLSEYQPRFKAISLVDNAANTTAIANDYGYEYIFVHQLERIFEKGDVLVAISASGNSKNIVNAVNCANKMGGVTVGLVGFDGGVVKKSAQHVIHISTGNGEYGPVEDMHLIIDHVVSSYFSGIA